MRSRVTMLEGRENSMQRRAAPACVARIVTNGWRTADSPTRRGARSRRSHDDSRISARAYHETNRWLIQQGVLPEIDLRPFIRRTRNSAWSSSGTGAEAARGFRIPAAPGRRIIRVPSCTTKPADDRAGGLVVAPICRSGLGG